MFLTSKRCFLNVMTQFMSAEDLLNANYYIIDQRSPDRVVDLSDQMRYNEDGQLVVEPARSNGVVSLGTRYNVKYGTGELDPTPFMCDMLVSVGETYADPHDRFIKHLNNTDTILSVYQFLFKSQLRGNGLQIMVIYDDNIVEKFGHVICEYLSKNFGADIKFIDPIYRKNVVGNQEYFGDKAYAEKFIRDVRDMELLMAFHQAVSMSGYSESVSNLTVFLNSFNFHELIYLYNLVFPEAPLPPDNYTTDHLKQIIIGRVTQNMPENRFNNLFVSDEYIDLLSQYDNEDDITEDYY